MTDITGQTKPSLSQLISMIQRMETDNNLNMLNWSNASSKLERMTLKQYKYALALWINGKNHDLKNLLNSFNI